MSFCREIATAADASKSEGLLGVGRGVLISGMVDVLGLFCERFSLMGVIVAAEVFFNLAGDAVPAGSTCVHRV